MAVNMQEYVLYSSRAVKLYEVLSLDTETVIGAPPLSVRTRLYVDILFVNGGATHVMVMMVVPTNVIPTEVGGSGLGGATGICCQVKKKKLLYSKLKTYAHMKVRLKLAQTCMCTENCLWCWYNPMLWCCSCWFHS